MGSLLPGWLFAASMLCRVSSGGELAVTVTLSSVTESSAPSGSPPLQGVDPVQAARTQRQHLLLLFQRYGDNNHSLSVHGFRQLLRSLGLERLRGKDREAEHHSHHPRHHHHHHHHHSQHAPHAPTRGSTNLKQRCPESGFDQLHNLIFATVWHSIDFRVLCNNRSRMYKSETEVICMSYPEFLAAYGECGRGVSLNETIDYLPIYILLQCLNASRLLTSHGIDMQVLLGEAEFGYICPAIINQIDRQSCLIHPPEKATTASETWVGGFISISVISILSLLGIILVPLMNRIFFKFLLSFLVALAVGTLSGDAFLHLLPHSHSKYHHSHGGFVAENGHAEETEEERSHLDATWKGLTVLGGLYVMFLVEHLLTLIKQYKDKKQKTQKKNETEEELEIKKNLSNHSNMEEKSGSDAGSHHESCMETEVQDAPQFQTQQPTAPEEEEEEIMIAHPDDEADYLKYGSRGCENKCHSHFHDTLGQSDELMHHHHDYHHILHHHHHQNHHPHSHSQRYSREELKDAGIATLAWMVIMGDGLHNFADGLAIGAAFTEGLSSGLSTSVAVFCHELPHELGDFAVLLKAGMTVKQAVLYNALSAMLAYLGMITGIVIGHYAENVSMWIFALTAGLFMYVAFVDMVPEMLHNDASDHGCSRWGYFLLQNAGILLGFFIMLVISVFEHKIVFSINL
uniref:Zinc transporter ZIP6 n=1 Tax=Leptobrachium leishanense TaxID=445787 RepID=A0A8C5WCG3_9ANUR